MAAVCQMAPICNISKCCGRLSSVDRGQRPKTMEATCPQERDLHDLGTTGRVRFGTGWASPYAAAHADSRGAALRCRVGGRARTPFRAAGGAEALDQQDQDANGVDDRLDWVALNLADPIGRVFLRLMLMVVLPLIFSALALAVVGLGDLRRLGSVGLRHAAVDAGPVQHRGVDRRGPGQYVAPGGSSVGGKTGRVGRAVCRVEPRTAWPSHGRPSR